MDFIPHIGKFDERDPNKNAIQFIQTLGSEMTLNHQVILEKYPFPNRVDGGSIPALNSSLYLIE